MARLRLIRTPLKYVQGKGALLSFHDELSYLGKRWLFVCSNSGHRTCHDSIEKSFGNSDDLRIYEVFGGISSNGEIARMQEIVRNEKIDVVVGVGGGSAIDTAKAVAHYEKLPVAVVPTVISTDAPCTGLSVIYNDDESFDRYLFYDNNPDAVIVDSEIIAQSPVKFLVAGMGDALGTYFEARACYKVDAPSLENGGVTRTALAIAKLCYDTLRDYGSQAKVANEMKVVTPALDAIIEANVYLSGVGADNGGLAAAHSFYNGVTALGAHTIEHGCCVAYGTLLQLLLEGVPNDEFKEVQDFCMEVGLPVTLAELGIDASDSSLIKKIADAACREGETIHNMLPPVDEKDLYNAIIECDMLGRLAKDCR